MRCDKQKLFQFMRFCTVGVGNTAVDFAAFFILNLGGAPYLLAQIISYSIGVLNSYIFNRRWTFRVTGKTNIPEVTKFIAVNGLSLLITSGLIYILHDSYHVNLWTSKIAATAGGITVNYIGNRLWVFTENRSLKGDAL